MKSWLTICLCLLLSGCATIISGSSQPVSFDSDPKGATVSINGNQVGKTPLIVTLSKKTGQTVRFEKDGFESVSQVLGTSTDWLFLVNVIGVGVFGTTTDAASGAINQYSPSHYLVTLPPTGKGPLERTLELSQAQKAKEFIVVGYRQLIDDLSAGKGEYLSSLFSLLKIPKESQPEATVKIRALSQAYSEIPEFADRVIDLYLRESPAK